MYLNSETCSDLSKHCITYFDNCTKKTTTASAQHTRVIHFSEPVGEAAQVLHAAGAESDEQLEGGDGGERRRADGERLVTWQFAARASTLHDDLGRREDEILHQLLSNVNEMLALVLTQ